MRISKKAAFLIVFAIIVIGAVTGGYYFNKQSQDHSKIHAKKGDYYCPMHPSYTSDRPGTCPICNMSLVEREASKNSAHTEHASLDSGKASPKTLTVQELMNMKPNEICLLHKCKMGTCMIAMTEEFARLGKCPHCGEDLGVIVKDALPQGYAKINLGADKQKVIGVKTAPVQRRPLSKTVRSSGRIAYDPELYQAEEEYLQAVQSFQKAGNADPEIKEQAAKLVDSAQIKMRLLGVSEEMIKGIESSGKPDRSLLYSDAGEKVWVYAPIYEYEIPFVKPGDSVEVSVPALPDKTYPGTVRSIDPVVDPVTRSIRIRAQLENPDGALKPEMYVNVLLRNDLGEQLAVPEEAVFMTGEKNIVFVIKNGQVFEPREIALGAKTDNFYQILNGLVEGETVVTSGNFLIDSESRLKAALEGVGTGGEHVHGG